MNKIFIVLVFMILLSTYSGAYDNITTHRKITEEAVKWSQLDTIVKNNLSYSSGYKEVISGQQIIKWLSDGSYLEDVPKCRASNHFHNPLLSWDQSYMTDMHGLPSVYCSDWNPRYSAITWATGYLAPPPDGAKASFSSSLTYGPNNWDKAREYYYKSFTLSNKIDRDIFFTWSLTALGQVMHLLQDMAVPAHTRNDFSSHLMNGYMQPFEYYVQNHPDFVTGLMPVAPGFDNTKLTDYWNANNYNGSNPSTFTDIGLAEFSNANYFSDYTIPNNGTTTEHIFPYPYLSSLNISGATYQICPQQIAPGIMQKYVSRKINGQSCPSPNAADAIDHFAAIGLFFGYPDTKAVSYVWLDDNVHNTYAKELLPRAVGYSAALLDYFFRGKVSITPVSENGDQYIIYNSGKEGMAGTFSLYYDDASDNRIPVATWPDMSILASNHSNTLTFTVPTNPTPKEKDRYILVFRGKMGNEEGVVAGRVVKWWREEWDKDLRSNHPWLYSDVELNNTAPYGQIKNVVVGGRLVKDNITGLGQGNKNNNLVRGPFYEAPVDAPYPNSALPSYCTNPAPGHRYCIDSACETCYSENYGREFPIPVNQNTWLSLKIDSMAKSVPASCPDGSESAYQGVVLGLSVGPTNTTHYDVQLNFTLPGNETRLFANKNYIVPQGNDYSANIYELLSPVVEHLEPISIYSIEAVQWIRCGALNTVSQQHMEVNYIRVMDR